MAEAPAATGPEAEIDPLHLPGRTLPGAPQLRAWHEPRLPLIQFGSLARIARGRGDLVNAAAVLQAKTNDNAWLLRYRP
jgi:hypothetical protein